ncbi:flavodoxin family protein [Anaerosporobacter sp.]
MKILVLNASPKGKHSGTMKLTESFLEGIKKIEDCEIDVIDIYSLDIKPCEGCFGCWHKTPGACVIQDDMSKCLELLKEADLILWSFPLYHYSIPAKGKMFLERTLPLVLPDLVKTPSGCTHPSRYDKEQKVVLLSSCGFYNIENNYEGLLMQFSLLYKEYTKVLCAEGPLLNIPEVSYFAEQYLDNVRKAGEEYARTGQINEETKELLDKPMMPIDMYLENAK